LYTCNNNDDNYQKLPPLHMMYKCM